MRTPSFTPCLVTRGTRKYWAIYIPASLAAGHKRTPIYFSTRREAEQEAASLRASFARGDMSSGAALTDEQARSAAEAFAALAASGENISLRECVEIAIAARAREMRGCTVAQLCEMYAAEAAPARMWSDKYARTWRGYSGRLCAEMGGVNIADVTTQAVFEWLSAQYASAASFNSAIGVLSPAFTWAVRREMMEKNPFANIEKQKIISADGVDVFTPDEALRLLRACAPWKADTPGHPFAQGGHVPFIYRLDCSDCLVSFAFLLFAGVRPAELERITWEDVCAEDGGDVFIHIKPSVAKTRQIRLIRVRATLQAFIDTIPADMRAGSIVPKNWSRKSAVVRKAAGLANRADAARHSFATYSLAAGASIADVQSDMGHAKGSDMLFKHYRAAASKAVAAGFWGITPAMVRGGDEKAR